MSIEHLKTNKIEPKEEKRNLLPTMQSEFAPPPLPEIEAYGGTGISPTGAFDKEAMNTFIIATLKCIYDPEIPVNIYDLGLIYDIAIDDEAIVDVTMTLTAPGCPVADILVREVADRVGLYALQPVIDENRGGEVKQARDGFELVESPLELMVFRESFFGIELPARVIDQSIDLGIAQTAEVPAVLARVGMVQLVHVFGAWREIHRERRGLECFRVATFSERRELQSLDS